MTGLQSAELAGSTLADQAMKPSVPKPGISAKQTRERLVFLSIGLVTAAAAATLYTIFGYALASAVLTGGLIWAGLMTLHLQIKKNAEIERLKSELARFESQRGGSAYGDGSVSEAAPPEITLGKARGGTGRRPATSKPSPTVADPVQQPRRASDSALASPHQNGQPSAAGNMVDGPQPHPRWEMPDQKLRSARPSGSGSGTGPATPSAGRGHHLAPPAAVVETALWPGTSLSAADPMRDQWAFRPKASDIPAIPAIDLDPRSMPASTIDADLEMVQRKIKALADEVNAAELTRDRSPPGKLSASAGSALDKSIGALKATADSMRERPASQQARPRDEQAPSDPTPQTQSLPFDLMIPATAERIAVSDPGADPGTIPQPTSASIAAPVAAAEDKLVLDLPPLPVFEFAAPLPPPSPRLAAIIAAVENGEMDVFLSPIVALQSHQVSHYDVTVRLKSTANGAYLDDAEQELQLAGSDVLALFDTARLKRAAMLAQRLDAHNKSGSLLSAVNGPSITNGEFLETFARVYEERDRISNQLVLTFSQSDIEQFSPSAWQALSDMHAFGFRFALGKIDHVAMDFAALAQRGFAFLRLEASALLNGLPARDRFIGADELCQHLAGAGMTLVADTIDDEAIRARVFGFGVLFGQGRLFGGPRQVKLDPLPSGSSAAA